MPSDPLSRDVARRRGEEVPGLTLSIPAAKLEQMKAEMSRLDRMTTPQLYKELNEPIYKGAMAKENAQTKLFEKKFGRGSFSDFMRQTSGQESQPESQRVFATAKIQKQAALKYPSVSWQKLGPHPNVKDTFDWQVTSSDTAYRDAANFAKQLWLKSPELKEAKVKQESERQQSTAQLNKRKLSHDPLGRDVARRRGEKIPTLSLASDPRDLIVKRCDAVISKLGFVETQMSEIGKLVAQVGGLHHLRGDVAKMIQAITRFGVDLEDLRGEADASLV